jgi:hypothetical protein
MGYIKEPEGVDLIIPPSHLTKKDFNEISSCIREYKLRHRKSIDKTMKELIKSGIINVKK